MDDHISFSVEVRELQGEGLRDVGNLLTRILQSRPAHRRAGPEVSQLPCLQSTPVHARTFADEQKAPLSPLPDPVFIRPNFGTGCSRAKNAFVAKTIVPLTISGHAKPAELAMQNAWQDSTARTTTRQS